MDLPDARVLEGLRPAVEHLLADDATHRRARELGAAMADAAPVGDAVDLLHTIVAQGAPSRY
jgi:UDP:flavonoid glycosyltransferase YjiC (YdhE family)